MLCKICPKSVKPRKKFCSRECYWKSKIGEKHSWGNKISEKLKGKPKSKEHIKNAANAHRGMRHPSVQGAKHYRWKGAKVGYDSLHDWVARYLGRPKRCKKCDLRDTKKMYHWANISGKYKRDLKDWVRLCVPCHSKMDRNR